jgi:uncharacterized protein DUF1259
MAFAPTTRNLPSTVNRQPRTVNRQPLYSCQMTHALLLTLLLAQAHTPSPQSGLDTAAIARTIGRQGQLQGDVYKISLPRTDLDVRVGDVKIRAGLALGSWVAFRATGADAIVDGDLVLTEREVDPAVARLFASGLQITALHNHLVGETPRIMYLHVWGTGNAAKLATGVRAALDATATPLDAPTTPTADEGDLHADVIQQRLGVTGTVRGGVLSISVPRHEKITMMGMEMPPSMGMATALNFQSAGNGTIVATGDFVLAGDEVNPVAKALSTHEIGVRALHNHMIHGTPELYFMHFWGSGTPEKVADGLRAALDLLHR